MIRQVAGPEDQLIQNRKVRAPMNGKGILTNKLYIGSSGIRKDFDNWVSLRG